jgi:hypothetical protein
MSISAISNHVREIIKNRRHPAKDPSLLYYVTLNALDSWHAKLPLYTILQAPSSDDSRIFRQEISYQQKTAVVRFNFMLKKVSVYADLFSKLTVQSLSLGIVCELLQPVLMTVLQNQLSSSEDYLRLYAR